MLKKWKVPVVTGLFVFGALGFILGFIPTLTDIFWFVWIFGCGACILGLILAVVVPSAKVEGTPPADGPLTRP